MKTGNALNNKGTFVSKKPLNRTDIFLLENILVYIMSSWGIRVNIITFSSDILSREVSICVGLVRFLL